jgi:hypothetical protein
LGIKSSFITNIEVIEAECKFVLWCKISKLICSEAVILGIVYIPPEYTSYSSSDAFDQIETEYMQLITNYKNIVLVGDFNARTAEEKDYIFLEDLGMIYKGFLLMKFVI